MTFPLSWAPKSSMDKKTLSGGGSSCSKPWSMDDGDLRKLLEKPGTVKDIGVLPDKALSVRMWGAPG